MTFPVTLDSIRAAHARIGGDIVRTPTLESRTLGAVLGARVFVKFDNLQFTASFKERGALNRLLQLSAEERARGVIAASAGNHAQGLSYHARRLGIPATIVMPVATPLVKVTQTEGHGARVLLHGERFDDAFARALEMRDAEGLTLVHPFDDWAIVEGQGTAAIELLEDAPEVDLLVVPIGGGGLISGMAIAAKALRPGIEVVGVQSELYPTMRCAVHGGEAPAPQDTIAEGIAVKSLGALTREVVREVVDDILLVPERDIERAISLLLQIEKTVVEGAGAAGPAAMLAHPERFRGRTVGAILCGGNIDTRLLANVLLRDLARSGRIARLSVSIHDQPGALYGVTRLFHEAAVNIIEVHHQRVFNRLSAKDTVLEVECEAKDAEDIARLLDRLHEAGFPATATAPD